MRVEKKEKVEEKKKVLEIQEEVRIANGEESLILEKGDRIQIIKQEAKTPQMKVNPAKASLEKGIDSIISTLSDMINTAGNNYQTASFSKILKSIKNKVEDLIVPYF